MTILFHNLVAILALFLLLIITYKVIKEELRTERYKFFIRRYHNTFFTGSGYVTQIRYAKLFAYEREARIGLIEGEKIIPIILEIKN